MSRPAAAATSCGDGRPGSNFAHAVAALQAARNLLATGHPDCNTWRALSGASAESPVLAGEKLFQQLGCVACHAGQAGARGPALAGVFGKTVRLRSGETMVADEAYLRESILNPGAKVVAGYAPIMPSFRSQVSEEQLLDLIAYIRSLSDPRDIRRTKP